MTEAQQYKKMSEMFRGEGVEDNPNNMCLVDQFLHGLDRFQGLFTTSIVDIQPGVVPHRKGPPGMLLTLIPVLHRKGNGLNIFVGKGSIEKSFLIGKTVGDTVTYTTGRTLLQRAKETLCQCKKMMAIVTASNLPYKSGEFPSGTNWRRGGYSSDECNC